MPPTDTVPPTDTTPDDTVPTDDTPAALCSDADLAVGDDPRGSAATFTSFLLIEHRTAFGREAADDALRALYGDAAAGIAAVPGLRPFAVRPVGRADGSGSQVRWAGRTGTDALLRPLGAAPSAQRLQDLATAAAQPFDPLFAVCTNGSRDRCCAIKGRDLAGVLHRRLDDPDDEPTVMEISHLGGHRYAPTMLVLPWGYAYAWLDADLALDIAYAAQDGLVHPGGLRGRADLSPAAQAAEASWRTELGPAPVTAVRDVTTTRDGDVHEVTATVDGTAARLRLRHEPGPTLTATACGGKPIATGRWTVV